METEKKENSGGGHSWLTKLMATRCEHCPMCQYARKKPETWFGKFMNWHGTWCPFWKAHEKVYKP